MGASQPLLVGWVVDMGRVCVGSVIPRICVGLAVAAALLICPETSDAQSSSASVSADSDGDGLLDTFELANGFDPLDPDEDGDGRVDGQDDFDNDGLGNAAEAQAGTNPTLADSDGDGLLDGQEIGSGIFGPQLEISSAAASAFSAFASDVDGDGDTDVLSASYLDDKIAWYENDGTPSGGAWIEHGVSTAADGGRSVFAADVDGDGDTDVLSASQLDDKIAWYENDGTPSEGAWIEHAISTAADGATSVFAADVDGDGDIDVVSASQFDDTVAWYENDATPAVGTWIEHAISAAADGVRSVFATDVDGDGDIDVLSASQFDDTIAWYENDATPEMGAWTAHAISTAADGASSVFAADVDGDGDTDVLSASSVDNKIAWYPNDGTPETGAWTAHAISIDAIVASSVFAADVDGDGDTDVLSASGGYPLAWHENDGTPSAGLWTPHAISPTAAGASSVFAADVDGDGDTDVLSASGAYRLAWYEQASVADPRNPDTDGDGLLDGFEVAYGFDPSLAGHQGQDPDVDGLSNLEEQTRLTNPTRADTDGDGRLDGFEVYTDGTSPILADTDGDGLLDGFEVTNGFDPLDPDQNANNRVDGQEDFDDDGLGNAAEALAGTNPNLPDSDGDGLLDGQEIGTGIFDSALAISATVAGARSVVAADVDGDGDTDVLSASSSVPDRIAWYENDGTPWVGAWTEHVISTAADGVTAVVAADLDGDGDTDVLSASYHDDTIAWYENDGTPSVGAWTARAISTAADGAYAVVAADVDGDGDTDVLSASILDNKVAWYENDRTPSLGAWPEHVIAIAAAAFSVSAADVDGDGDADVLTASRLDNRIAWYENDGTPSLGAWTEHAISTATDSAFWVFAADVDGDGDTDVLSAFYADDKIAWYENDATPELGAWTEHAISTAADGAISALAADVDGDGDTDVLSALYGGGKIAWYENDATPAAGAWTEQPISTAADRAQSVFAADVDGDGDTDVLSASEVGGLAGYAQRNVADPRNPDTDGDGLTDGAEVDTHGTDPTQSDTDGDGLTDSAEVNVYGTDATQADTDGDGLRDGFEVLSGFNPHSAGEQGQDPDADGLTNLEEQIEGSDPTRADTDGDGLRDGFEVVSGFDPLVAGEQGQDPDADGLSNLQEQTEGSNPTLADTDTDGLRDGFEVANDFDPLVAGEQGQDPDADGLTNLQEQAVRTSPTLGDSDGDGRLDGVEVYTDGTNPALADTDRDGLLDGFELANGFDPLDPDEDADNRVDGQDDFDSDGLGNATEPPAGTDPRLVDTDGDGLLDGQEFGTGIFGFPLAISTTVAGARSVFAADVDGDGDLDALSAASNPSGKIAWYENDATPAAGTWTEHVISTAANGAQSVFAADVDRDGDTDVLSASQLDDKIAWYENDGTPAVGVWTARAISTAADGATSVFAADVDGDGDTDVLSASQLDDTIAWYENDATPDVGAWTEHAISTAANGASSVFAADVDGDGDADVLSASSVDNKIAWYPNDGTPEAGAWTAHVISTTAIAASSVIAADVDGDGDTDVLSASGGYRLAWHENDGTPSVGAWRARRISSEAGTSNSVFAGDVDGDGDMDVLSASFLDDAEIEWYEQQYVADPLNPDTDGDGLSDGAEVNTHHISPTLVDTDADGLLDGFEVAYGLNPLNLSEQAHDPDADGLTNLQEQTEGTHPRVADSDGDGLRDGFEVTYGFDPLVAGEQGLDPDADGLSNLQEQTAGANPTLPDTDGDGLLDPFEVAYGFDPSVAGDQSQDPDGDGLTNLLEQTLGTNPTVDDTDGDGRLDGFEVYTDGTDPTLADSDGDGLQDGFEVAYGFDPQLAGDQGQDPDADGLTNLEEQTLGTNPTLADTDGDTVIDGSDNCPVTANPTQSNGGGVLGQPADDVGDACQCGDVDDDGDVDLSDLEAYRGSLADPDALGLTLAGVAKCSVIDSAGPCEMLDVAVIQRALEGPALLPGIAPVCTAATGP